MRFPERLDSPFTLTRTSGQNRRSPAVVISVDVPAIGQMDNGWVVDSILSSTHTDCGNHRHYTFNRQPNDRKPETIRFRHN